MSKKISLFMPCDKASHICDKSQYKEASLWEKIKLTLHIIICEKCRCYSKNNAELTENIKKAHVDCLTPECKEQMKKDLEQKLKKQED